MSKRDYYEVLGVSRTADESELKSAYRKIAMKSHPDRHPGDKAAEERFKEAAEAYAVLADAEKRSLYDRFGHAGVKSAAGGAGFDPSVFSEFGDFADILGGMFGFGDLFGGGRRRGGPQRGADLRYDLEISFEESAKGTETTIQIPRQETCETCSGSGARQGIVAERVLAVPRARAGPVPAGLLHGRSYLSPVPRAPARSITKPCQTCRGAGRVSHDRKLTVKIPAGIADGQQLRLQGEGEAGAAGGPAGHLYVVVHVHEHEFFRRDGLNLFCEIPVNFTTLALGGEIVVPTLDGPDSVKVPEGTRDGHDAAAARQGHAGCGRPRTRRPLCHRAGADTEKADEGTAPPARAAREGASEGASSNRERTTTSRTNATCSIA